MLADNQKLTSGPLPFVVIPPAHYCVVIDPIDHTWVKCYHCLKYLQHTLCSKPVVEDEQCELKFGHTEVRLHKVGRAM